MKVVLYWIRSTITHDRQQRCAAGSGRFPATEIGFVGTPNVWVCILPQFAYYPSHPIQRQNSQGGGLRVYTVVLYSCTVLAVSQDQGKQRGVGIHVAFIIFDE